MSDTTFVNAVTLTDADWFNDVNRLHYTIFGDPANAAAALTSLGGVSASAASITGTLELTGDISPTQITANQNDYNPTGLSTAVVLRLSTDASRNITGIAGGADGRLLTLFNIGSFPVVLKTADTGSSAANRFDFDTDVTLQPDQGIVLLYDSTDSRWRTTQAANGEYRSVQVFTTSGANTWTKPAGLKRVKVTVIGAGGGGAGSNAGVGNSQTGGGGGGGGTAIKTIAAASLGATETATVGAIGTGGVGAASGSTGGTSSFGAHATATGGSGGTVASATSALTLSTGAAAGVGASGDVNAAGAPGGWGASLFNTSVRSGVGGSSSLGGGGTAVAENQNGTAGGVYGGGGSGAASNNDANNRTGGAGALGIIIVEEFF